MHFPSWVVNVKPTLLSRIPLPLRVRTWIRRQSIFTPQGALGSLNLSHLVTGSKSSGCRIVSPAPCSPYKLDPDHVVPRAHPRIPRPSPPSPVGRHVSSFFPRLRVDDAALRPICVRSNCCPISSSYHRGWESPSCCSHYGQHS